VRVRIRRNHVQPLTLDSKILVLALVDALDIVTSSRARYGSILFCAPGSGRLVLVSTPCGGLSVLVTLSPATVVATRVVVRRPHDDGCRDGAGQGGDRRREGRVHQCLPPMRYGSTRSRK
jgi:hypothetical protein